MLRSKVFLTGAIVVLLVSLLGASCAAGVSQEEFDAVVADLEAAEATIESLQSDLTAAQTRVIELESTLREVGLTDEEVATLSSLEKVDDYPLYTMHYHGSYDQRMSAVDGFEGLTRANLLNPNLAAPPPAWACSLFAALGDAENMLYGRNLDFAYFPAILLFTDPPDGYASVSMVNFICLGFEEHKADTLTDLSLIERRALLNAPFLPFDGMNEHGLVVGVALALGQERRIDPDKGNIGACMVMRKVLDHASNIDEAVAILQSYNIVDERVGFQPSYKPENYPPPFHYLIAAPSGRAVLVEFYQGEMVVIPNETPWHLATNFLLASVGDSAKGNCWRYDRMSQRLRKAEGLLTTQDAMDLLAEVAQGEEWPWDAGTQWSIVYGISTGDVYVTMGRQYDSIHTFHLSLSDE